MFELNDKSRKLDTMHFLYPNKKLFSYETVLAVVTQIDRHPLENRREIKGTDTMGFMSL